MTSDESGKILGKLFLIVGPSGSGKGTVIKELKRKYAGFAYPVSYTTREPREGEADGEVYHYVSKEKFKKMIDEGEFLEYAVVHSNNYYGTSRADIMEPLQHGGVVIREVDIQGFHSIRGIVPAEHLVSIFMEVRDPEDLKGRILRRGEISEEELAHRMESAQKEIAQSGDCDYQVNNEWGKMKDCVYDVEQIILAEIKDLY